MWTMKAPTMLLPRLLSGLTLGATTRTPPPRWSLPVVKMSEVKIEFNDAAFIEILKSPEVQADLLQRANAISGAAGDGTFDVTPSFTPTRARVSIGTADHAARHAEATNRSLTSALDAGRG
jgi:hypothetical protein